MSQNYLLLLLLLLWLLAPRMPSHTKYFVVERTQCKIKPTTLVGFFLFASDPCGKLASGGSDPCGRLASGGSDPSGELASGGSDPSGELASGGLCFELDFALQPRNSEYHLPRFILLSQPHRLNTKFFIFNRSRGTSYH